MPDYIARHGTTRFLGVFSASGGREYRRGARVIVRTERGLEVGDILCAATPETLEHLKDPGTGQILREMTPEDVNESVRIQAQAQQEMEICQRNVDRLGLKMQLVELEHIFGGERIVVYYLAENRVDFRELVKALAGEFQTRIEMRQIGVRDEAKLLADYGDCGGPVCCNTHLVQMPPVSMRMAKLQKATLDPTKISGRCGRLKCCLRYEYETYEQMQHTRREEAAISAGSQPPVASGDAPATVPKVATAQTEPDDAPSASPDEKPRDEIRNQEAGPAGE